MMMALVILFLITTAKAKHHHSKDPNENFFGTVYVTVHSIVDDLFESINLGTNFVNATNLKLLLTMHNDLSNIADKTFETYNDIKKTAKVNINNQSVIKYFPKEKDEVNLDTIVKEILNKNNFDVYNAIKRTRNKRAKDNTKDKDKTQVKEQRRKIKINTTFDDSKEFTEFVIKFLTKVNNLNVRDFKSLKDDRVAVPPVKNLKVWDEPVTLKYDLEKSYETRRIFKGLKTQLKSFPFVVSIHIMGEFTCSGCIISRDFVITAASCLNIAYKNDFFKRNLKSIYVRMGSDHTASDGETIPVQNVYFHPGYEPEHLGNNLALIKLEKRFLFSRQQKRIRRILWDRTPGVLSNDTKNIFILGWGDSKADPKTPKLPKLRMSKLDVYNTDACRKKYSKDLIRKENFCAALNGANGSACSGDAGGPGIVGAVLVGVVSFGVPGCGFPDSPTVFTKLGYYVPWIDSIVNAHQKINHTNFDNINTRRQNMYSKQFKNDKTVLRNNQFHGHSKEYPKEVKALRNTLMELIKSDPAVVDEAIYGETYDEFSHYFNKPDSEDEKDRNDDKDSLESLFEVEFEFDDGASTEQEEETHTETPIYTSTCKKKILRKPLTDTESLKGNHAVHNDYTDNYEVSSKDEHELSFEVPKSFKKKSFRNKKVTSEESESISDKSNEHTEEIKKFYVKNQKYSEKKNSHKKAKGKSLYLSGAPLENEDAPDASSMQKESSQKVVMKHNRLSKHASSVLDEGKSFATKNVLIDAKTNYDNHKHQINSRTYTAKSSSSKKRKDKSKSSDKKD